MSEILYQAAMFKAAADKAKADPSKARKSEKQPLSISVRVVQDGKQIFYRKIERTGDLFEAAALCVDASFVMSFYASTGRGYDAYPAQIAGLRSPDRRLTAALAIKATFERKYQLG